jgi:outer membrane protein assembly factor BamE (lipoprotein component of BamABCDE complex)
MIAIMRISLPPFVGILTCLSVAVACFFLNACDRTNAPVISRLTKANVDQVQAGMTKSQVQALLGPPTDVETKDLVIYKRTTYRYLDGKVFVNITFKNDELDAKKTNICTQ